MILNLCNKFKSILKINYRNFLYLKDKNYVVPDGIPDIIKFMSFKKPDLSIIYVKSTWN